MYQPTDDYFPKLHALVLSGTSEPKTETSASATPEPSRLLDDGRDALAALKLLEQEWPSEPPPEEIAGQVRYLVEHYVKVLDQARKALLGTSAKSEPSPQVREALKEFRYKNNWKFKGYIASVEAELPAVLQLLKRFAESVERKKSGRIGDEELANVKQLAERCLKLAKVGPDTEHQVAKQINTANSKMMGVLRETLECKNLDQEAQVFLSDAKQNIADRIAYAAQTHGADFKSCDSAGIDVEVQIQRAEAKCKQTGQASALPSRDNY